MNSAPITSIHTQSKIPATLHDNTHTHSDSTTSTGFTLAQCYKMLALAAFLLAFVVVGLGAYTRLVHAGLGCPDWPGCYGHLTWPTSQQEISAAEAKFPETPVELDKTWPEMVHRYFAGTLGLLVLAIVTVSVLNKKSNAKSKQPIKLPFLILAIVIVQAAFGMWTVTLKLWPQVVTLHLLGGFTTLALLGLLNIKLNQERLFKHFSNYPASDLPQRPNVKIIKRLSIICLLLVVTQISLGGWTAANYAALPCHDFPTCQGTLWPTMDFKSGFNVTQTIGPNYLGGQLDGPSRTAIHVSHRIGAGLVFLFCIPLIILLYRQPFLKSSAVILLSALTIQIALGISNVVFITPLPVAILHNLFGVILLLSLIFCLSHLLYFKKFNLQSIQSDKNLSPRS